MQKRNQHVVHHKTIPERVSGSSTKLVYRLGVSPTGAASKPWKICHKVGNLSGYQEEALNKGTFRATLRSGFTLIELLVVVLIIGILAAVAVPQYKKAVYRSRFATVKNLAKSIADAQEVYYLANGKYTNSLEQLDITLPTGNLDTSTADRYNYDWGWCRSGCYGTNEDECSSVCQNDAINMQYQVFLLHHKTGPKHRCTVLNSTLMSDLRNQICKAETGADKPESTSNKPTDNNHWRY